MIIYPKLSRLNRDKVLSLEKRSEFCDSYIASLLVRLDVLNQALARSFLQGTVKLQLMVTAKPNDS